MDPIVVNVLKAVVPAGVLGVVGFGAAWWSARGPARQGDAAWTGAASWRGVVGPLVLGLAAMTSFVLLNTASQDGQSALGGLPSLLPGTQVNTLWPLITLIAVLLGVSTALLELPSTPRLVLRLALYALLTMWAARAQIKTADTGTVITLLAGAAAYTHLLCTLLEMTAQRRPGPVGPLAGLIVAGGASQMLILGFSTQTPAFQVAALSAALGGAVLMAFIRPRLTIARGTMTTLGVLVGTMLIQQTMFGQADGPWALAYLLAVLLAAAAPVVLDMSGLPDQLLGRRWLPGLIKVAAAGAMVAAGAGAAAVVMMG